MAVCLVIDHPPRYNGGMGLDHRSTHARTKNMETLEHRVAKLEQSNRRWRCGAASLFVLAVAIAMMGAEKRREDEDVADVIRARRIEVVRENGDPSIVLGRISLSLLMPGAESAVSRPCDGIAIRDKTGRDRMAAVSPIGGDGGALLAMMQGDGKPMAMLYDEHGAGGELDIYNKQGKPAVGITGTNRARAKRGAVVGATGGGVAVFDGEGKIVGSIGNVGSP